MKIIKLKDYKQISEAAGEEVKQLIRKNPTAVLGLATGSSPIGLYDYLIKQYKKNKISFKDVQSYNLDEYCQLDRNHSQSYYTFMHENFFNDVDINEDNIHIPFANDLKDSKDCQQYSNLLEKANIDLQILGIGSNGHIGFNEPGTSFDQKTFIVELTKKTREDNKRFFSSLEDVPTHAITMGIGEIMKAKKILLIASGTQKSQAIHELVNGDISEKFPASILKKHPDVTIYIDEEAGMLL